MKRVRVITALRIITFRSIFYAISRGLNGRAILYNGRLPYLSTCQTFRRRRTLFMASFMLEFTSNFRPFALRVTTTRQNRVHLNETINVIRRNDIVLHRRNTRLVTRNLGLHSTRDHLLNLLRQGIFQYVMSMFSIRFPNTLNVTNYDCTRRRRGRRGGMISRPY